ncbi:hypothetical protein V6N12_028640 [Hibiscus sabdariffa]|uniref:RNase H type-1 domain-containing protein n=1 Tax=Hibiscus sabdariffa TaxID=183260 RepID=A0ABR2F6G2_9ROSI
MLRNQACSCAAYIFQTKLWTIYHGLVVTWSLGLENIGVQYDSKQAIHKLQDPSAFSSFFPLVRAIIFLCERSWYTDFHWISRDTNKSADFLAKLAPTVSYSILYLDDPADEITPLLDRDKLGLHEVPGFSPLLYPFNPSPMEITRVACQPLETKTFYLSACFFWTYIYGCLIPGIGNANQAAVQHCIFHPVSPRPSNG